MRNRLLLIVIMMLGTTLRFWGITHDLPNVYNLDEPAIMNRAIKVADGNLRHGVILRGSLPYYAIGAAIKLYSFVDPKVIQNHQTLSESYAQNKTVFYSIGRSIVALYGVIEIALLYLLTSLLFNRSVALLSSFFLSITPLSVSTAHIVNPNTGLSATLLFTLYICALAYKFNKQTLFLFAGFLAGLSAGQKFPGVLSLPIVIIFFVFSHKDRGSKPYDILFSLLLIVSMSFIGYFLSYPFIISDYRNFVGEWQHENSAFKYWDRPPHIDFGILNRLRESTRWIRIWIGTFSFYASIVGFFMVIRRKNVGGIIISLFVLLFFLANAIPIQIHEYRFVPLVPYVSMFSAYACIYMYRSIRNKISAMYCILMLILLISFVPLVKSLFIANSYASLSTRTLAQTWSAQQQLDQSAIIRDPFTTDVSDFTIDWVANSHSPVSDLYIHKQSVESVKKYQYAIVDDDFAQWYFIWERSVPSLKPITSVYRYLDQYVKKEAVFMARETAIDQDDFDFLLNLNRVIFQQTRGPTITIYKLQ